MAMNSNLTPDRANRMAIGIARNKGIPYSQAEEVLRTLSLRIVVGPDAGRRVADQAALLTAVNTAHRAFLGGVEVQMPPDLPMRLPLRSMTTLDQAIGFTGCSPMSLKEPTHTIYIGTPPANAKHDDVCVHCDSWRAGVSDVGGVADFTRGDVDEFALGGVMAGAMAVHRCFIRATNLPASRLDEAQGMSLWNPYDDWRQPILERKLYALPNRFWMLGLGHLGQAFLWALALLPFSDPSKVDFLLHDFDTNDAANIGSCLLCTTKAVGIKKARHCADWLQNLGFKTASTERRFTAADRRGEDEPAIAFCGFDRAVPRVHLDNAGFGLVIECGLGGSLADFDQAEFHIFPSPRHSAKQLWGSFTDRPRNVDDSTAKLFSNDQGVCGALAIDVAGKSVSTSFVGAMSAAIAVAELLRTFNRGSRFDRMSFDARLGEPWSFLAAEMPQRASQLGELGFVSATTL